MTSAASSSSTFSFASASLSQTVGLTVDGSNTKRLLRTASISISKRRTKPEIFFINEIVEAYLSDSTNLLIANKANILNSACIEWQYIFDDNVWTLKQGNKCGQTWIAQNNSWFGGSHLKFNELFDNCFSCKSIANPPKLLFQVLSSKQFIGYGFIHLPLVVGNHSLDVPIFRPKSVSWKQSFEHYFLSKDTKYKNPTKVLLESNQNPIYDNCNNLFHKRISAGVIKMRVSVLHKELPKYTKFY